MLADMGRAIKPYIARNPHFGEALDSVSKHPSDPGNLHERGRLTAKLLNATKPEDVKNDRELRKLNNRLKGKADLESKEGLEKIQGELKKSSSKVKRLEDATMKDLSPPLPRTTPGSSVPAPTTQTAAGKSVTPPMTDERRRGIKESVTDRYVRLEETDPEISRFLEEGCKRVKQLEKEGKQAEADKTLETLGSAAGRIGNVERREKAIEKFRKRQEGLKPGDEEYDDFERKIKNLEKEINKQTRHRDKYVTQLHQETGIEIPDQLKPAGAAARTTSPTPMDALKAAAAAQAATVKPPEAAEGPPLPIDRPPTPDEYAARVEEAARREKGIHAHQEWRMYKYGLYDPKRVSHVFKDHYKMKDWIGEQGTSNPGLDANTVTGALNDVAAHAQQTGQNPDEALGDYIVTKCEGCGKFFMKYIGKEKR